MYVVSRVATAPEAVEGDLGTFLLFPSRILSYLQKVRAPRCEQRMRESPFPLAKKRLRDFCDFDEILTISTIMQYYITSGFYYVLIAEY